MEVLQSTTESPEFLPEDISPPCFVTAPSSPRLNSCHSLAYFYSAPSSPTSGLTVVTSSWEAKSEGHKSHTEINDDKDDFEFETSRRFGILSEQSNHHKLLEQQDEEEHALEPPKMSFADELFSNGHVLPLKLPPRLQHLGDGKSSNKNSTVSSPRASISVSKGPFLGMSFNNKDCPFMAALEHIRKEGRGRDQVGLPSRRALSSIGAYQTNEPSSDLQYQGKEVTPSKLADDPTGKMRSISTGHIDPSRVHVLMSAGVSPQMIVPTVGAIGVQNKLSGGVGSLTKFSKRWRIKDFLFRSASEGRVDPKDKLRDKTAALVRSTSLNHAHVLHYGPRNGMAMELKKKTYLPYKPALLGCLGFGSNGAKNSKARA